MILMRGPHSYTGEDTVEINCHGGVFVVRKILETVLKNRCQSRGAWRIYEACVFEMEGWIFPVRKLLLTLSIRKIEFALKKFSKSVKRKYST